MLVYQQECYNIIGAAMCVYNTLSHGFLEAVYQEALSIELLQANIPFEKEKELSIHYGNLVLDQTYRADFVCYGKIIVELKAVSELDDVHRAQVMNYLHATGCKLGLLINFGNPNKLEWERIVL